MPAAAKLVKSIQNWQFLRNISVRKNTSCTFQRWKAKIRLLRLNGFHLILVAAYGSRENGMHVISEHSKYTLTVLRRCTSLVVLRLCCIQNFHMLPDEHHYQLSQALVLCLEVIMWCAKNFCCRVNYYFEGYFGIWASSVLLVNKLYTSQSSYFIVSFTKLKGLVIYFFLSHSFSSSNWNSS